MAVLEPLPRTAWTERIAVDFFAILGRRTGCIFAIRFEMDLSDIAAIAWGMIGKGLTAPRGISARMLHAIVRNVGPHGGPQKSPLSVTWPLRGSSRRTGRRRLAKPREDVTPEAPVRTGASDLPVLEDSAQLATVRLSSARKFRPL